MLNFSIYHTKLEMILIKLKISISFTLSTLERTLFRSDFCYTKNQSHVPSFLLFRKARSHRRTACKRAVLRRFTHYHFFTIPRLRREVSFLDSLANYIDHLIISGLNLNVTVFVGGNFFMSRKYC